MIYECCNCGKYMTEEDLKDKTVCLEEEYGCSHLVSGSHYETISVCPYCGNDELDEYEIDEDEYVSLLNGSL